MAIVNETGVSANVTRIKPNTRLQSSKVKRTPQNFINEFIIRKLSPLAFVDFRFISEP